ncbi:hypothetical protein D5266_05330 [bacterium c-19]|nr:hypothetical protein [bacterium c-19]
MNLLRSSALFLWMLGSSAYLCAFYLQLKKHKHQKQEIKKRKTIKKQPINDLSKSADLSKEPKTQLLEEWEDLIWEYTDIKDLL